MLLDYHILPLAMHTEVSLKDIMLYDICGLPDGIKKHAQQPSLHAKFPTLLGVRKFLAYVCKFISDCYCHQ